MRSRLSSVAAALIIATVLAAPTWAQGEHFSFSTGNPDGRLGAASRPASPGKIEIESADDFFLADTTAIGQATFTGLLTGTTSSSAIQNVVVEIYRIFPKDSDTTRAISVPTRTNSPADVDIAGARRDGTSGTLGFSPHFLGSAFVANTVVNGIHKIPNQTTGGEGPVTGTEVEFTVHFTTPIILPADHYFFVAQVQVAGTGDVLWLSAPKPIVAPGTPFTPDLQAWIRNENLQPDWLRVGTDIIGGTTPPTFNLVFSLTGNTIPRAGTPGQDNCQGKTTSALARQFGGIYQAFLALGASSTDTLQEAIVLFCGQ